jgi:hypothetical protein
MTYEIILWLVCASDVPIEMPAKADDISWHNLRRVAADLELWSPRGNWNDNFAAEINWVRNRWQETCDAPPLSDLQRIPSEKTASSLLEFANLHLEWLQQARYTASNLAAIETAIEAQSWRCNVLRCIISAHQYANCWHSCRATLKCIRDDYLGREKYHLGLWPEHVPWWTFALGK